MADKSREMLQEDLSLERRKREDAENQLRQSLQRIEKRDKALALERERNMVLEKEAAQFRRENIRLTAEIQRLKNKLMPRVNRGKKAVKQSNNLFSSWMKVKKEPAAPPPAKSDPPSPPAPKVELKPLEEPKVEPSTPWPAEAPKAQEAPKEPTSCPLPERSSPSLRPSSPSVPPSTRNDEPPSEQPPLVHRPPEEQAKQHRCSYKLLFSSDDETDNEDQEDGKCAEIEDVVTAKFQLDDVDKNGALPSATISAGLPRPPMPTSVVDTHCVNSLSPPSAACSSQDCHPVSAESNIMVEDPIEEFPPTQVVPRLAAAVSVQEEKVRHAESASAPDSQVNTRQRKRRKDSIMSRNRSPKRARVAKSEPTTTKIASRVVRGKKSARKDPRLRAIGKYCVDFWRKNRSPGGSRRPLPVDHLVEIVHDAGMGSETRQSIVEAIKEMAERRMRMFLDGSNENVFFG